VRRGRFLERVGGGGLRRRSFRKPAAGRRVLPGAGSPERPWGV